VRSVAPRDREETIAVQRAQAREQTRQRLLEAALAILESAGEAALTTTAITRRAGISQSGFYNYFADMEDMLWTWSGSAGRRPPRRGGRPAPAG
jgi:DNA-binding transcriptional regulator YbjK